MPLLFYLTSFFEKFGSEFNKSKISPVFGTLRGLSIDFS